MAIMIKGMEMPKGCASCFLKYGSCSSIRRRVNESKVGKWCPANYRHPDCPLIEVPEDVQPVKHGRWISIGHKLSRICSVCNCDEPYKFADDDANVYDYCPNCGAKMDGET